MTFNTGKRGGRDSSNENTCCVFGARHKQFVRNGNAYRTPSPNYIYPLKQREIRRDRATVSHEIDERFTRKIHLVLSCTLNGGVRRIFVTPTTKRDKTLRICQIGRFEISLPFFYFLVSFRWPRSSVYRPVRTRNTLVHRKMCTWLFFFSIIIFLHVINIILISNVTH